MKACYEEVLRSKPNNVEALVQLAKVFLTHLLSYSLTHLHIYSLLNYRLPHSLTHSLTAKYDFADSTATAQLERVS